MRTLYLDCGMGAAGDMLTAALLELLPDPDSFVDELNALGIPGVRFTRERCEKCGITGTHMRVTVNGEEEESHDVHHHDRSHGHEHHHDHDHAHEHDHPHPHDHDHDHDHAHPHDHGHTHAHSHHHHAGLQEIAHIVRGHLALPQAVQDDVMAVYQLIAEAESHAHGKPVDAVHFHEVGAMDAIADITAVCLLMHRLAPDQVVVSPVHVGSGQVRCAHGILPVPAPATAFILKGVPIYGGQIQGELCTPTGAALLKHFASRFGAMPLMRSEAIGYGMGRKDFPAANCVRAILGESAGATDDVVELRCNVDDMSAEAIGFAMDRLFEAGALDVYTTAIGMKKCRPGTLIQAMCREADKAAVMQAMFRHTTTIGIRENPFRRYVLKREIETIETPSGPVRRKISSGYGVTREKLEFDDLARIAEAEGLSLEEVRRRFHRD